MLFFPAHQNIYKQVNQKLIYLLTLYYKHTFYGWLRKILDVVLIKSENIGAIACIASSTVDLDRRILLLADWSYCSTTPKFKTRQCLFVSCLMMQHIELNFFYMLINCYHDVKTSHSWVKKKVVYKYFE
jgi:hypothetical protein